MLLLLQIHLRLLLRRRGLQHRHHIGKPRSVKGGGKVRLDWVVVRLMLLLRQCLLDRKVKVLLRLLRRRPLVLLLLLLLRWQKGTGRRSVRWPKGIGGGRAHPGRVRQQATRLGTHVRRLLRLLRLLLRRCRKQGRGRGAQQRAIVRDRRPLGRGSGGRGRTGACGGCRCKGRDRGQRRGLRRLLRSWYALWLLLLLLA